MNIKVVANCAHNFDAEVFKDVAIETALAIVPSSVPLPCNLGVPKRWCPSLRTEYLTPVARGQRNDEQEV